MSKYLEVAVVAMRLNVSTSTVYRLIQRGKIESMNAGVEKGIRVCSESLIKFEERRRNNGGSLDA